MVRFHVLYPANVFIFTRQLAQPGTPGNIFTGLGVDPNVIYSMHFSEIYDVHPCQDIGSVILLPAPDILFSGAYLNRPREVQTTVAALFAGEFHEASLLHRQRYLVNRPVAHIPYQSLPAVDHAFVLAFGTEPVNPVIYLELDF